MQQGRWNREVRKSPPAYQNVTRTSTYYTEGFLFSIAVKEEKKLFCAPEYYRAGTRMAAQQQQKSYNRPLHFFPYKIDILLSPKSYRVYLPFFYYTFSCQTSSVHRGIRKILTTLMLSIGLGLGLHKHTSTMYFVHKHYKYISD